MLGSRANFKRQVMRATREMAFGLLLLACRPSAPGRQQATIEQGRTYADWLFSGDLDKLWARFSPEMRRTFPSVAELSAFVSRTTVELGRQTGMAREEMRTLAGTRVYTRTAAFARAERPVEVQFAMSDDGRVTGILIHPVLADSAPR